MDTVEYSQHLMRVGSGIMRIAENAESAADHELDGAERASAVALARAKLADYQSVLVTLQRDSKVLEAQFVKHFEDDIGLIRESLQRIDAADHT
jgi:hypothetical protein